MDNQNIELIIKQEMRENFNKQQMEHYYARKAKGTSKQIIPKEQQKKRGRKPIIYCEISNNKESLDKGIKLDD